MTEFNIHAAAAELTSEGTNETVEESPTPTIEGQTTPVESHESTEELNSENILNELGKEQEVPQDLNPLLEQVNGLGLIHNGSALKIESPEQLKEFLQKGFDYTKKTMALAEEAKVKNEEFTQRETKLKEIEEIYNQKMAEHEQIITDNNVFTNLLLNWKQSDPEIFSFLQNAYQQELTKFQQSQPIIAKYEGQIKQLNERFNKLEQGKQSEELSSIKNSFEKDLGEVQAKNASNLAKLGVKVDWEKVKTAWTADATGKMSVEQALHATYGKEISKAYESYKKLLSTKNKVQANIINKSGIGGQAQRGASETKTIIPGDYESLLRS